MWLVDSKSFLMRSMHFIKLQRHFHVWNKLKSWDINQQASYALLQRLHQAFQYSFNPRTQNLLYKLKMGQICDINRFVLFKNCDLKLHCVTMLFMLGRMSPGSISYRQMVSELWQDYYIMRTTSVRCEMVFYETALKKSSWLILSLSCCEWWTEIPFMKAVRDLLYLHQRLFD